MILAAFVIEERLCNPFYNRRGLPIKLFHFQSQSQDKIARNLVDYEAGKTIFECAKGIYKANNANQTELF